MSQLSDTLKNYRVRTKISILSTFLLAIILLIAAIGVFSSYRSKEALDDMYSHNLMATQYLNDANNRLRSISVNVAYILQQNFTRENRKLLLDDISGNLDNIRHDMARPRKASTQPEAIEARTPSSSTWTEWVDARLLIDALPPERREALILTQILGYTYEEAAKITGVRIGTIRSRVARARADVIAATHAQEQETKAWGLG